MKAKHSSASGVNPHLSAMLNRAACNTGLNTQYIAVTPAIAEEILKQNTDNRKLRTSEVERNAEMMRRGEWHLTHQGIAFDTNGRLADGQHRLEAVVESGVTVKMAVTRGLAPETFAVLDQGAMRSSSDILGCGPKVAQLCSLIVRYMTSKSRATPDQLQLAAKVVEKIGTELQEHCGTNSNYFSSAPMRLAAVTRILAGEDKEFVFDLYAKVCRAEVSELPPGAAALMKMHIRGTVQSVNKDDTFARGLFMFNRENVDIARKRSVDTGAAVDQLRSIMRPRLKQANGGLMPGWVL